MKKCSAKAFAMCPDRAGCLPGAVYMEGSDCEKFNEVVDKQPMTNADRIRAMSDEELAKFSCNIILPDGWMQFGDEHLCPECAKEWKKIIQPVRKEMENA